MSLAFGTETANQIGLSILSEMTNETAAGVYARGNSVASARLPRPSTWRRNQFCTN